MTSDMAKRMIIGSMAAAGVVALMALMDLVIKIPFAGYSMAMDILFLCSAVIVLYLGWDAYKELR
ncbi:MAG: hypothetical protein KF861_06115 [Planctomycetaceae bacterium]|nr:hypothetical protein [Planctomycetaceae bacterium]